MKRPTICLNMIVKNEAPVIGRCLAAARPLIDRWCIVDTGSGDGTQNLVRQALEGVPGALHERPWQNFGFNRTEALQLALEQGCDYLLFIDADEWFDAPAGFAWPALDADAYELSCLYAGVSYARCALVATRLTWRWEGVLHEYLASREPHQIASLPAPRIVVHHDGARARDPQTYLRDIALLEGALAADPNDTRNTFYLAQSYRDAGRLQDARDTYLRRAGMGGWDEEVWYSAYQAAAMLERLQASAAEVCAAYLSAFEMRPTRIEPLVELARFHRLRQEYAQASVYAHAATQAKQPADRLFVDAAMYRWRALDELAISAYYAKAPKLSALGQEASRLLLARLSEIPVDTHERVRTNAGFYGIGAGAH